MLGESSFGITVTGTYLIMYQRYYPKRYTLLKNLFVWFLTAMGTCHYATIILEETSGRFLMGAAQNFLSIARSFDSYFASDRGGAYVHKQQR